MLLILNHTTRSLTLAAFTLLTGTAVAQNTARDSAAKRLEVDRQRQARITLIRIAIEEAIAAGDATLAKLDELRNETDNFNRKLNKLLESDEGKRIVKDRAVFLAFRKKVYDQGPASLDDLEVRAKAIETVLATLKADLSKLTDAYVPSPAFAETIEKHSQWASQRKTLLAQRAAALKACLAAASPVAEGESVQTLKEAIDKLAAEEFREIAALYDQVVKETQPQKEALLRETVRIGELQKAQEEATAIRLKLETEIDAMKKEHALKLAQLQKERDEFKQSLDRLNVQREEKQAEHQREIDKQRLIAKCKDAKVQEILAPFITAGYWQPINIHNGPQGKRTTDKKGVSLKALSDGGALAPGDNGVGAMLRAANSRWSDRPTWGFDLGTQPPRVFLGRASPELIEKAKKAQELLRELGPTLVELGKLSE